MPGARNGVDAGATAIRNKAQKRIDALRAAAAAGEPVPPPTDDDSTISFNDGKPWDPKTNPLRVGWAPAFANDWLNAQIGRAKNNIARIKRDPNLIKDAVLGALPSTLFVLLPLFAVLLKVLYVFKRRLYMEHLIVALHSHAFLCLSLLLVFADDGDPRCVPRGQRTDALAGSAVVRVDAAVPAADAEARVRARAGR